MSNTDSFIEEVTEEVRRDRLFALLKRYGWIGILLVLLIVGGAAWREYSRAQDRATAEALGDSILAALEAETPDARIVALAGLGSQSPGGAAIIAMFRASEAADAGDADTAISVLSELARNGDVPRMYRDIAGFKLLLLQSDRLNVADLRAGFQALSGGALRLLAQEQLALIDMAAGDNAAARDKFQGILADSEVTAGLRQRVSQLIVALGGELGAN